jgi:cytochrome c oxidase cbb3-type subunit 4
MDIGTVRGLLTLAILILFLAIWAWSWSRKRQADFEAASKLPLDEDNGLPPVNGYKKEHRS